MGEVEEGSELSKGQRGGSDWREIVRSTVHGEQCSTVAGLLSKVS